MESCFLPMLNEDETGNGIHLVLSLYEEEKNIVGDKK